MSRFEYVTKTIGGFLLSVPPIDAAEIRNPPPLTPTIDVGPGALNLVGRGNEELRENFSSIFLKISTMIALRDDVFEVAQQIDSILKSSERVMSELAETKAKFGRLNAEHDEMLRQFRAAREENENFRQETTIQRADLRRFEELVATREKRIVQLELEGDEASKRALAASRERDIKDAEVLDAREQLVSARNCVVENDVEIAKMEDELEERNTKISRMEFLMQGLQRAVEEGAEQADGFREEIAAEETRVAALKGELSDARIELDARQKRIEAMEEAIVNLKTDLEISAAVRQQQSDNNFALYEDVKSKLGDAEARAASAEQMLAEARSEAQLRSGELRAAERRNQELKLKLIPLDERIATLSLENFNLSRSVTDLSASRVRLANRSQALVRAMKDQKAKIANASQTVQLLDDRIAADRTTFDGVAEDLRGQIRGLADRLEQERAAHQMDLAALALARERTQPGGGPVSLHELLARADAAESLANGQERGRDLTTRE